MRIPLIAVVRLIFFLGCLPVSGVEVEIESTLGSIKGIADFDIPLDDAGALAADDRNRFLYALSNGVTTEEKLKALVALWFDSGNGNLDSITLAWWSSAPNESALRVLAMAAHNLRWEPTSAKLPFKSWSKRFDQAEESIRISEYGLLNAHAKEIASLLSQIALREVGGKHLDVLKQRLQAVAKEGMGNLE